MIVYARSMETLRSLKTVWREPKPGAKEIWDEYSRLREKYGDNDKSIEQALQEWYRQLPDKHPSKALSRYKHIDKYGPWRDRDISWPGGRGPRYDVIHPVTKQPCKVPERGWGFANPEAMQRQIELGLIEFREDHTQPPFRKAHLRPISDELDEEEQSLNEEEELAEVGVQVMSSVIYKQSQVAVRYLRDLMGAKVFDTPKDHEVIARIIGYVTASNQNDIILDSFAGSGTTGQATLALNAEDGGNRRFILIEQESYADTLTAERLRRVIRGLPGAKDEQLQAGYGGSFTYLTLGQALHEAALLQGERLPTYLELARYVFFTTTGEQLDEAQLDESRWYLGQSHQYEVYMLYRPDMEFLKRNPFNLPLAEALAPYQGKTRLVVGSHKYLDDDYLWEHRIEFCQLPFAIYRFRA